MKMFEMKLGEKFADLTDDLNKLRRGEVTNKAWIFNLLEVRYERDAEKWLTDLENFLINDFRPLNNSRVIFKISLKEKIRKEGGQRHQRELNELADLIYYNGDNVDKSDKLLSEITKEKEVISEGKASFYFKQVENTPDKLIKSYLAEMIKVVELREKSCQIVNSVGSFYQYIFTPELLKLSSFSPHFQHLSKHISSSVDNFVKQISKKYEINSQFNLFLQDVRRSDGRVNESWYGKQKWEEVQKILAKFANKPAQDIEKKLLSYEVLTNLLRECFNAPGGQLKLFLTEKHEEENKAKIEAITNLEQAKKTYREIVQYLYDLRRLAKDHIELVDKELQNAKEILGEDITNLLPKPEEDFVQDGSALKEFTEKILGEINKKIVESRAAGNLDIVRYDNSKKDQLTTDLEDKQNQIKILGEKLAEVEKEKKEVEEKLSEKENQIRLLKGNWDKESSERELKENKEEKEFLKEDIKELEDKLSITIGNYNNLLSQRNNLKEKYKQENEKLQQLEKLNENLLQKTAALEDSLVQAKSDFQREKEKLNGYKTKLKTELDISDIANWETVVTSLKSRPEQDELGAANDKITAYENGLNTIFSRETIIKDDVVAKVIPATSEPSQVILNIATWKNDIYDKLNNSQLETELQQAKQELYGCKSKLVEQEKQILQKFIVQLELKLEDEEITITKVIQTIKELLGRTPGQEISLRSENEDQKEHFTNLNKILVSADEQTDGLKVKIAKINKENTNLTSQNRQLHSQLSQKEKEKLLGIMLGVESGVFLTFVVLFLIFKKKRRKLAIRYSNNKIFQ